MPLANGALVPLIFLVELFPLDPVSGQVTPQYLATAGFTTEPTDSPANQIYDAVVTSPYQARNDLYAPGRVAGRSDAARGAIILNNPSDVPDGAGGFIGRYDRWRRLRWSGRRARVLVGAVGATYASFAPVMVGWVTGRIEVDLDVIKVPIANVLDRLNRTLQPNLYAGTGGAEGGSDLAGFCKPRAYGVCREVPAPLIDPANLIYQLHDGPIAGILAAYERGAPIAAASAGDYPTYAALAAITPALGTWQTCLARGLVRLGSQPAGPVTFDLQGDASGAGYVSSAARIVERIITACFGLAPGSDYDPNGVAALDALQPAVVGWWSGTRPINGLDAVDQILGGIGAWYSASRAGLLTMGRLDAPNLSGPADPAAALSLGPGDIMAGGVTLTNSGDPPSAITLTWRPFYQTQTTGYATSLSPQRIADLASQTRSTTVSNAAVAAQFPNAVPLIINGLFDQATDAQAEAARQLQVGGVLRDVFQVKAFTDPFAINLGDQVWFAHPRYDLAQGQAFRVIGMDEDGLSQTVTLTLWG